MRKQNLTAKSFKILLEKVFALTAKDQDLLILVDVPNMRVADTPAWEDRRALVHEWLDLLQDISGELGLKRTELLYYENCGSNNADLPAAIFNWNGEARLAEIDRLSSEGAADELEKKLWEADIILAATQFSATAPLKLLARKHGFRAASMPGFNRAMIPALSIDYEAVHEQVLKIKTRLDKADSLRAEFDAEGKTCELHVDLRNRTAHASSGLIREPGTAWNLPSGEAFIVPYEGELADESTTGGVLPVQFGHELVEYKIERNRAVAVLSSGPASQKEAAKLAAEPAYGNIAEIGFGVLRPFGIKPIGEMLLDEKLGLHLAFGRSDHFGGATSAADFREAENVVHIDRIYIPEVQEKVGVVEVCLGYANGKNEVIIKAGDYLI